MGNDGNGSRKTVIFHMKVGVKICTCHFAEFSSIARWFFSCVGESQRCKLMLFHNPQSHFFQTGSTPILLFVQNHDFE